MTLFILLLAASKLKEIDEKNSSLSKSFSANILSLIADFISTFKYVEFCRLLPDFCLNFLEFLLVLLSTFETFLPFDDLTFREKLSSKISLILQRVRRKNDKSRLFVCFVFKNNRMKAARHTIRLDTVPKLPMETGVSLNRQLLSRWLSMCSETFSKQT
jgi:hypothetical protein